jgi:peptide deformylase
MHQQAKAKREKKWLGYVATIVQHLCDQGAGHQIAVSIAESYSYTKAKQFAQRIKRGEA